MARKEAVSLYDVWKLEYPIKLKSWDLPQTMKYVVLVCISYLPPARFGSLDFIHKYLKHGSI